MTEIYIDGIYTGNCDNAEKLVLSLKEKRRKNILSPQLNIAHHKEKDEIQLNLNGGRVRRPLIAVENGKPMLTDEMLKNIQNNKLTWKDLIDQNIIEFIDAEEEENAYIATTKETLTKDHTHLEIDPILILGIAASLLAYPEKDRGDRLNYGSRMIVQSTGIYLHNYLLRDDTTAHLLLNAQRPIVQSQTTDATGLSTHPTGQNLIIAVMPYYSYNIEDSIVINKSSLERGLGRSLFIRTHLTEARRYWGGQEDEIGIPDPEVRGYKSEEEYSMLGEEGIVSPETSLKENNILVGKTSPLRFLGIQKEIRMGIKDRRENSLTATKGKDFTVEKVILASTKDGNTLIKVSVREQKIPEVGDKFASRHGQKGVIGLVVPEENMPFTKNGITPDIIINPHAIPSRMTVGQLLEIIAGKKGSLEGKEQDGTAFKGNVDEIRTQLRKLGYRDDGKERLYNGVTGEIIEAPILIGIGYYMRLYHMVSHKIHARSRGPIALLTKQPTEGRSKEGGLRFGEMEKDCLIAHGAAVVLKERFSSDKTQIPICKECGITAIHDRIKNKIYCPLCKGTKIENVEMSYAFKLLLDELRSMLIYPQIVTED
ncbi:MAG: DNA-directed RNA polymerase subunit B [Candidatus Nanohalarchaeota archaeon]|nr:MAG: DNA-directed RNA polymerase subunit B [Candidatus Nanohaloarchaeota archaeon]